jgi:formylmethanofuran dehydrogenase subunit E
MPIPKNDHAVHTFRYTGKMWKPQRNNYKVQKECARCGDTVDTAWCHSTGKIPNKELMCEPCAGDYDIKTKNWDT